MVKLLGNSAIPQYIKLMSGAILFITYLAVLMYGGLFASAHNWDIAQLPPVFYTFVGAVVLQCAVNLGIHVGASVSESGQSSATPAPPTPTPVDPAALLAALQAAGVALASPSQTPAPVTVATPAPVTVAASAPVGLPVTPPGQAGG